MMSWLAALILALGALLAPPAARAQEPPTVAAASDLSAALPEIAAAFQRSTGQRVRLTYGSSGNFAQQIQNGAPYQLFLSADEAYVRTLYTEGRTQGVGARYAVGRIGLFIPRGSKVRADASLRDLELAAADGRLRRLAIANPEHAPYGRAARQALQQAGVWRAVVPRLALGENVSQATQFATSGSAQAGIIPLSLAVTPQVKRAGRFVLIPADRHRPIRQRMVLLKGAGPTAAAFYRFLQGPQARAIFTRHGFTLPAGG